MELTLNKLIEASQPLSVLVNIRGMKSIVAYRIAKNYNAIKKELEDYENARIKLLKEYSNKDDDGNAKIIDNNYDIIDGCMDLVNKEIDELKNEKIDLDIKKVTLEDVEIAGLAPIELESIEFMLDFEEEE